MIASRGSAIANRTGGPFAAESASGLRNGHEGGSGATRKHRLRRIGRRVSSPRALAHRDCLSLSIVDDGHACPSPARGSCLADGDADHADHDDYRAPCLYDRVRDLARRRAPCPCAACRETARAHHRPPRANRGGGGLAERWWDRAHPQPRHRPPSPPSPRSHGLAPLLLHQAHHWILLRRWWAATMLHVVARAARAVPP